MCPISLNSSEAALENDKSNHTTQNTNAIHCTHPIVTVIKSCDVKVAAVKLQVVNVPVGKWLRVDLHVELAAREPGARLRAKILVDAKL